MTRMKNVPSVSVTYAQTGGSTKSNELGMRAMQERAYEKRGEQYLLIKSSPASGKSRALMFIALDKLENQGVKQAIVVVPVTCSPKTGFERNLFISRCEVLAKSRRSQEYAAAKQAPMGCHLLGRFLDGIPKPCLIMLPKFWNLCNITWHRRRIQRKAGKVKRFPVRDAMKLPESLTRMIKVQSSTLPRGRLTLPHPCHFTMLCRENEMSGD